MRLFHLPQLAARPVEGNFPGDIRTPHFSHYRGGECGIGYETALHLLAKEVLARTKRLLLPPLRVFPSRMLWWEGPNVQPTTLVANGTCLKFERVTLETALGQIVPDIMLEKRGRRLLVEIKVTHGVDKIKLAKIKDLDISTIEFDFSRSERAISEGDLRRALIDRYMPAGLGGGRWIHHAKLQETQDRLNREYLAVHSPT